MEVLRPGLVSRPDFMGLGLVSVSSLKGLGLARGYSIETTRSDRRKKRHEKSTQFAIDSRIPSEKMKFFA